LALNLNLATKIANATQLIFANEPATSNMNGETFAAKAVEKTLCGKVQKQTFPPRLEIPQKTRDSHFFTAASTPRLLLDTLSTDCR
jgi:hypothetical protein